MKRIIVIAAIIFAVFAYAGATAHAADDTRFTRAACPVGMPAGYTCQSDGSFYHSPANWVVSYGSATVCLLWQAAHDPTTAPGAYQPAPAGDTASAHCVGTELVQAAVTATAPPAALKPPVAKPAALSRPEPPVARLAGTGGDQLAAGLLAAAGAVLAGCGVLYMAKRP